MGAPRCYFYGCWGQAGHYIRAASTNLVESYSVRHSREYFGAHVHIDGSLAPRELLEYRRGHSEKQRTGRLTWSGRGATIDERNQISYDSAECPQGQFLLHHLPTGYTAIQWWDRVQGDVRGGCNSTVMLEGRHSKEALLEALEEHFLLVASNLRAARIALVEVRL